MIKMTRFLIKSGLLKLIANKPSNFLPSIDGVNWSNNEATLFKQLYLQNNSNDTILNELQNMTQNFKSAYNMKFSDTIPTLFFLSKQTCKQVKNWEQLHLDITNQQKQNKVILYDGTHFTIVTLFKLLKKLLNGLHQLDYSTFVLGFICYRNKILFLHL